MKNLVQSKGFRAFPLVLYGLAAVACLWATVASIVAMSQSVVAGAAGLFGALILAGVVGFRITFKWKHLHNGQ